MPAVTLGAVVGFGIDSAENKGVLVGGRAGYNFNVTENLGVWGRAGVSYNHVSSPGLGNMTVTNSATVLNLSLPIMYHVVPHLFVGLAPYYNLKVVGRRQQQLRLRQHHRRLVLVAPPGAPSRARRRAASPDARAATSALRTAMPSALREPTRTTRRLPRVTAV